LTSVLAGAIACHCTKIRTSSIPSAAHADTAAAALASLGSLSRAASSAMPVSMEEEACAAAGRSRATASATVSRR
jgi:hypothetical protein